MSEFTSMSLNDHYENDNDKLIPKKSFKADSEEANDNCNPKSLSLIIIGVITVLYVIAELAAALYVGSLALLSDGFHNLTDAVSLYIAYWAQKAAKRDQDDTMSYGWARAEVLGGLTNGCFLVSMSLYVALEAIPRLIHPEQIDGGAIFMSIAGAGLAINTIGTIVFACTGMEHAHSHGGGGGHSHGGEKKKVKKEKKEHGHSHDGEKKEKKEHGHSHDGEKKEKKEHGHSHDGEKKEKKHGHSHDGEKKEKKDHGHAHGGSSKKGGCMGMDLNMFGVFIHFLGDAISSLFVLITGALIHFYQGKHWTVYVDPISSLVIVAMTLASAVPLVKKASMIMLQYVPTGIDLEKIRQKISKLENVVSQHDLHVWTLVDGMTISSVHVGVVEGADFGPIAKSIKKIFHHQGIHSTSIQPEFISRDAIKQGEGKFCAQNCVEECDEDWCCKKPAEKLKVREIMFSNEIDV